MMGKFKGDILRKTDYVLLIIIVVSGPFTQLRIAKIGISEIASIMFVISILFRKELRFSLKNKYYFIFTKFWLIFFVFMTFGFSYNMVFRINLLNRFNKIFVDLMAYIIVSLICISLELLIYNIEKIDYLFIYKKIFYYSSIIFLILFILSRITSSIFGYTLLQEHNFRPLATNVHHAAMSMAPLPFIGLMLLLNERKMYLRILIIFLMVSNIFVSYYMGSTKLLMGLVLGVLLLFFFFFKNIINKVLLKYIFYIVIIITIIVTMSIKHETILKYAIDFFQTEDVGGARQNLWSSSVPKIMKSPLIGYGPGPHAVLSEGVLFDAHQTILTIGLQAGVIMIIVFFNLIRKMYIILSKDAIALSSIAGIFVYSLGGDILRRIPMWIFLILSYYFVLNNPSKSDSEKRKWT